MSNAFQGSTFFWGIPALLWQICFFYMPLSILVAASFVEYVPELHTFHFTLAHYHNLFQWVYLKIILRSLLLACTTVAVTLCIAYPVAYYLVVKLRRWSTLFFALLMLPFWTNFLLLVYAWYFLLENDGLLNTIFLKLGIINAPLHMMNTQGALICGMFYCYLPFMLLPLYSTFERLDTRLLEASKDLGANSWQTMWNITIPLMMGGIRTGALLVFIPSFGEFVIPALLGGDKSMYIGTTITHYFLGIRDVSAGSAFTCGATIILVTFLFVAILAYNIFTRKKKHA